MVQQKTLPAADNQPLDVATFELKSGTTLIEASAGTGKTYTIQYIVLDLLFKGLSLSEILVVTFTEAATKELADRLQSFLTNVHSVLSGASVTAEDSLRAVLDRAIAAQGEAAVQNCLRRALLEIDQAAIYTIHGFCQRALQENAFAADANFDAELCTDVASVVEELAMDFLRRANLEMPHCPPKKASLDELVSRGLKLTGMMRSRFTLNGEMASLGQELTSAVALVRSYEADCASIIGEFMSYEGQLNGNSYNKAYFQGFAELLVQVLSNPLSADVRKLCAGEIQSKFKKAYLGTELQSGFFTACGVLQDAKNTYEPDFFQYFDSWFIQAFQRIKLERGLMTYNDMILDLDRALARSESLQRQLQQRYRAALVDEFQDTDDRQYSIFKALFASAQSSSEGRYFAMIGDPKQSIYGFRGADISAYLEARCDASNRYTLPMNFRSDKAMVDATNNFFAGSDLGSVMPGTAMDSIAFEGVNAADQLKNRLVFAGDELPSRLYERALAVPADGSVKTAHQTSTRCLVEDVQHLLKLSSEGRVYFESRTDAGLERRAVHEGDIAVLINTKSEAAEIQYAFQKKGILAVRAKTGNILETSEAKDFLYFLMACLNPHDRYINFLLVGALCGKNNADLNAMTDAARCEVYELFTMLGQQWRSGDSVSLVWMRFLEKRSVRERLLRMPDGERKLTNYLHIVEYAQNLERTERLSPERLRDRLLEAMRNAAGKEEHLVRLESDSRAVKIMTCHASKGLEFPIVFLPGLWQRGIQKKSKSEERICATASDPDCLDRFVVDPDAVVARSSAENLRLGYVAMTRAVHFCVYYNVRNLSKQDPRGNHKDGWFDRWLFEQRGESYPTEVESGFLNAISLAAPVALDPPQPQSTILPRVLQHTIEQSYRITSYSSLARTELEIDLKNDLSASGRQKSVDLASAASRDSIAGANPLQTNLMLTAFTGGKLTGNCVHDILERCDFTQPGKWEPVVRSCVGRSFPDGGERALDARVEQMLDLLKCLVSAPRDAVNGDCIDLSRLHPRACIHEMEFYFAVEQVKLTELEGILQDWGKRVGLPYAPVNYRERDIDGFLTGSVDLFFKQGARYYILDWKTNLPLRGHPRLRASYDRAGMHALMQHGRYYLQALIYSVAVDAYLRQQLGAAFDWDMHMGGFIYCFVRGLGQTSGWHHESFSEAEVLQAGAALGRSAQKKGVK
jgi:exodeoxyribonuclease V beta subunit